MMQLVYTYMFSGLVRDVKTLCLCISVIILSGCTKADMMYPTAEAVQGYIVIHPDQSEHTLPALEYYFYNVDTQIEYFTRVCDGIGNFEGTLPVGKYRIIAVNTNASGVTFSDMHSHEQATVYTGNQSATRGVISNISDWNYSDEEMPMTVIDRGYRSQQFDKVYSAVMSDLTVSDVDTLHYEPVPALLTREITLTFTLDEKLSSWVSGLSGSLYGVYPSVHLFSGVTSDNEIRKSPETCISYSATANTPQTWTATMQVFGLYNPEHGEAYSNIMPITLNMNGTAVPTSIDLTGGLSDILSSFEGNIPVEIPLEFEVEMQWNGIEVISTVRPWKNGGTGEGEVN